jgi:uncharacterized membrane protein
MNWKQGLSRISLSIKVIGALVGITIIIVGLVAYDHVSERLGASAFGLGFATIFYGVGWILDGFTRPNE